MTEHECDDLDAAVAAHEARGLRIDMIMPADDPAVIEMSGGGERVRLLRTAPPRAASDAFHLGRAGMLYRDLIADRVGGRLIASHIKIPAGGPVADYVHYHAIEFQIIYCRAGWVRVVYEDQGEPFTMQAGDCVVQPPQIRHRVLDCSPGLEVIELATPAAHATYVDHDLVLPNGTREREYGGQRFSCTRDGAGVAAATNGLAHVRVVRGETALDGLCFGFVLAGEATLGERKLVRDDAFVTRAPATLQADGELLLVRLS